MKCPTCGRLHQGDTVEPVQIKAERKNITQPQDWWIAFITAASVARMPLSEWIGDCCVANLPKSVQAKLSDRRG